MTTARVSVIIPTFNRAATLPRAVESVLRQTHPAHEVIIVDDGSTDSTSHVVASLVAKDGRIRCIRQENLGAPAARNAGVAVAKGDYIAFQDSDDEWNEAFLARLLALHTRPKFVAFCSLRTIDTEGEAVNYGKPIARPEKLLLTTNCISTQTALIDATLLENRQFDESLSRFQDWDLWLDMLDDANFVHLPEPLATQHLQRDSLTFRVNTLDTSLRRIIRKHWRKMRRSPGSFLRLALGAFLVRPLRRASVESDSLRRIRERSAS